MEKGRLSTNQHKNSLKIIEQKGRFINRKEYILNKFEDISEFFIEKYDYFTMEVSKRLDKPVDVEYPIWCGISKRATFANTPETVIYELLVPKNKVIYFDGSKWDHVLNNIYLPVDEKNVKDSIKKLKNMDYQMNLTLFMGNIKVGIRKSKNKLRIHGRGFFTLKA